MELVSKLIKENAVIFVRYALFAGTAVIVDLGLLYVLTDFAGLWYLISAAISYVVGVTVNFTLNRFLNFKSENRHVMVQYSRFVLVATTGLIFNQMVLYSLVEFFGFWYISAKLIALFLISGFSFYCHKNYTFR